MIKWLMNSRKAKLSLAIILTGLALNLTGQIPADQLLDVLWKTIVTLVGSIAVEDGLKGRQPTSTRELLEKFGGD